MFEKVNPRHPDKVADRIAGAIVDEAYRLQENPKVAVEVLIGHGKCLIINETSVEIDIDTITNIVERISDDEVFIEYLEVPQDTHLAANQAEGIKCGDNGIFKGVRDSYEQRLLVSIVKRLYKEYNSDGKYVLAGDNLVVCQSKMEETELKMGLPFRTTINPLGYWEGGINTDSGATNRKLGSDMGDGVTGGGLHGKDLSKADVSVNIYCWIKAQHEPYPVETYCAIGDTKLHFVSGGTCWDETYEEVVKVARHYIDEIGGFEKFAEWGLIR